MTRRKTYGDFQTPLHLAQRICKLVHSLGPEVYSVVEPTCGTGNFLIAACEVFESARHVLAVDTNEAYVNSARKATERFTENRTIRIDQADFFKYDWHNAVVELPEPLLIIGNPPWVTNAGMTRLNGENLPSKCNTSGLRGIEARTGKSNFDISEWMIWHLAEIVHNRRAMLAFLCKTGVARKILSRLWRQEIRMNQAILFRIDAKRSFDVNADAGLLIITFDPTVNNSRTCKVYSDLDATKPVGEIGLCDGILVSNMELFNNWAHLKGREWYKWRSGIKHDCSRIMELKSEGGAYRNGLGELLDIETEYLFPLLKGSDVGNGMHSNGRYLLITQHNMNEETSVLQKKCPKTWAYLCSHADLLDNRASVIYKGRPRFCLFGVGAYAFSLWKVAISALYKRIEFRAVGPRDNRPTVFDDTVYYLPCHSEDEARFLERILNSTTAKEFLSALIFWDTKRPISIDILRQLDIRKLARELNSESELLSFAKETQLEAALD